MPWLKRGPFLCILMCLWLRPTSVLAGEPQLPTTGEGLYEVGCAKCHGVDGRGSTSDALGFDVPLPDLTDCSFATREPDTDWIAVTHEGGPIRGFDQTMPAYGEAFDLEQIQLIIDHIRGFCPEPAWPRGELNFPRPLVTEKAYPEDELVWTTGVATEGSGDVANELLYERRFGARHQLEIKVPFGALESEGGADDGWRAGFGDVALGVKSVLFHDFHRGSILSLGGEVILPTGDDERGFGKGSLVFEPFLALGQALPSNGFLHLQAGVELPTEPEVEEEIFWRAVLGTTLVENQWGRSWSPMVEVLGQAEPGGKPEWDLLPQLQVSLNRRQHILLAGGVRLPLTRTGERATRLIVYLLWEWFDGGFFEGW